MKLEVTFKNIRPRDEIRKRAAMLSDKLDKFTGENASAHLLVTFEHEKAVLELNVKNSGEIHTVNEEDDNLRTALDRLFHKVEIKLRRHKEKHHTRRRRGLEEEDGFEAADS